MLLCLMKRFLQIIDKIYAAVCTTRCPRGVNCKMYVPAQKHFRDSPTGDSHAGKRKRTCVYAKCRLRAIMRANYLDRKFRKIGRQRGGAERTLIPLSSTKRTAAERMARLSVPLNANISARNYITITMWDANIQWTARHGTWNANVAARQRERQVYAKKKKAFVYVCRFLFFFSMIILE